MIYMNVKVVSSGQALEAADVLSESPHPECTEHATDAALFKQDTNCACGSSRWSCGDR